MEGLSRDRLMMDIIPIKISYIYGGSRVEKGRNADRRIFCKRKFEKAHKMKETHHTFEFPSLDVHLV